MVMMNERIREIAAADRHQLPKHTQLACGLGAAAVAVIADPPDCRPSMDDS